MKQILYFTAPWCEPCKTLKPEFRKLATEYPDLQFDEVDVSVEPKIANAHKVRSVPTVLILQDGETIDRYVNPTTADQIRSIIDSNHFIG